MLVADGTQIMNIQAFWVSLGVGSFIALLVAWKFSRRGGHPRFRPALGVVLLVLLVQLAAVAFVSTVISKMVGNPLLPVMTDEERKASMEREKREKLLQSLDITPNAETKPSVEISESSEAPVKPEEKPTVTETAPVTEPTPVPAPVDLPEPTDELPEPAAPTPEDVPPP